MRILILTALSVSAVVVLAMGGKQPSGVIPTHIQNPGFVAGAPPKEGENPVDRSAAEKEWKELVAQGTPPCTKQNVWAAKGLEDLRVTAFKDENLPVKGLFTRSTIVLVENTEKGTAGGSGAIDLSSYDTGNQERDWRVQREVFQVENSQKPALAKFTYTLEEWSKSKKMWNTNMNVKLSMAGGEYQFSVPVNVRRFVKAVKLTSLSDGRFTFATADLMAGIERLMKYCNHHSIASFVDTGFEVTLDTTCAG